MTNSKGSSGGGTRDSGLKPRAPDFMPHSFGGTEEWKQYYDLLFTSPENSNRVCHFVILHSNLTEFLPAFVPAGDSEPENRRDPLSKHFQWFRTLSVTVICPRYGPFCP